jgi:hypothetical protein
MIKGNYKELLNNSSYWELDYELKLMIIEDFS